MTPQLGSTSSRAVFFLFFLSAAAFAPPSRSAPPACSAANMPTGPTAFIATSPNLVTVLDASTKLVVCTITVGNGPSNLAFSPDGTQLFVVNDADTTISVVSLADGSIQATIDLTPFGVTAGTSGITGNLAASPDPPPPHKRNSTSLVFLLSQFPRLSRWLQIPPPLLRP